MNVFLFHSHTVVTPLSSPIWAKNRFCTSLSQRRFVAEQKVHGTYEMFPFLPFVFKSLSHWLVYWGWGSHKGKHEESGMFIRLKHSGRWQRKTEVHAFLKHQGPDCSIPVPQGGNQILNGLASWHPSGDRTLGSRLAKEPHASSASGEKTEPT